MHILELMELLQTAQEEWIRENKDKYPDCQTLSEILKHFPERYYIGQGRGAETKNGKLRFFLWEDMK
jgi:RNA:NAD 2'-phosphotransferase (TPT1/KptA family)